MYSYSGPKSSSYNNPLREIGNKFLEGGLTDEDIALYAKAFNSKASIRGLAKAFDLIDPLPEPLWVYRGAATKTPFADHVKVGSDYIDPGFMSTSIKSGNTFGMTNLRLAIYLPAGSRVLPILNHSQHSSEMEVLLPPMSVCRIIKTTFDNRAYERNCHATVMFMGSAWKSLVSESKKAATVKEMMQRSVRGYEMTEATKKYDRDAKFGGSKFDGKNAAKLTKLIKSGKVKLDTTKKKK